MVVLSYLSFDVYYDKFQKVMLALFYDTDFKKIGKS